MDAKTVALLVDGGGMLAAIVVGGVQLRYGFHVFRAGYGKNPARTTIRIGHEPPRIFRRAPGLGQAAMARPDCRR
jgi:hypothetical protein